jgi:putative endonuclease
MLRCRDGTLYTGATTDIARRLRAHAAGRGARYTRARLPVELVFAEACASRSHALRREAELKRLRAGHKRALVAGKPAAPHPAKPVASWPKCRKPR